MQITILDQIAERTRIRIAEERARVSDEVIKEQARKRAEDELAQGAFTFPFEQALKKDGTSFICEVKKASPSKGTIVEDFSPLRIAYEYELAGASAISCLTEPYWFHGSNEYLSEIAKAVSIPVLRKDFTVDARMVYEAKMLGASAVLLICSLLSDEELRDFLRIAHGLGLSALVEAHNADEIARALSAGARIIGVNNRDLTNFKVDTSTTFQLRKLVGGNVMFVSESGIKTREDIVQLEKIGVDAVLIGETLMRSVDKTRTLAQLRGKSPAPERHIARFAPQEVERRRDKIKDLFDNARTVSTSCRAACGSTGDEQHDAELDTGTASRRCRLKTCGISRMEDVIAVNEALPDFCGFIIGFPKSTRNVTSDLQRLLVSKLDPSIFAIGVFVNAPIGSITKLVDNGSIDAVQLHGNEDEGYLAELRSQCIVPIIKAFRITDESDLEAAHNSSADMLLLDSGMGSGVKFNWSLLKNFDQPYFLAGGLTPQSIPEAHEMLHPWGMDISSGLETNGSKDSSKIHAAVTAIRSCEQ